MTDDLRRAVQDWWLAAEGRSWTPGILGRPDGVITVPNRPAFVYVRTGAASSGTVTIARNAGKVPLQFNLPVKMRREGGVLVIYSVDTGSGIFEAGVTPGVTNPHGVQQHTHKIGTGLEYEVEAQRLEPGRLRWSSGMIVYVNPFRYYHNGAWDTWTGGSIDLTAYKPVTSGHWAWVLVGVNPATNTAVAVAGTSQIYATPLTIDQLDAIAFSSYIPSGAVKVRNDDTTLTDVARYFDAREWFGRPGADGKLATVIGINALTVAQTTLYTVPVGKSLIVTHVVIRCTAFTVGSKSVQAVASFGGNASTYDDYLNSITYTIAAASVAIVDSVLDAAIPVYAAGTAFKLAIETGSNASVETWAADVFGYLV